MKIIKDIINKEVIDYQANILGTVSDVEIDTSNNTLLSIIVSTKDGFRKDKDEKVIPFEEIGRIGDKIIIKDPFVDSIL